MYQCANMSNALFCLSIDTLLLSNVVKTTPLCVLAKKPVNFCTQLLQAVNSYV